MVLIVFSYHMVGMTLSIAVGVIFITYLIVVPRSQVSSAWQSPLGLIPSVFIIGDDADLSNWEIMKRVDHQAGKKEEVPDIISTDLSLERENWENQRHGKKEGDNKIFFRLSINMIFLHLTESGVK